MKNIICLIAFIGFFIAGIQSASAQWKYNVSWNDTECNCGTINEKTIIVTITYLLSTPPDVIVYQREFDITNETSPFEVSGTETIVRDCEDCYHVYTRVVYYDSTGDCCHGYETATVDGENLVDGFSLDLIYLY